MSADPFITLNTKIRRFTEWTWTKTKNSKLSKKSEASQEDTGFPSSSKRTMITALEILFLIFSDFEFLK